MELVETIKSRRSVRRYRDQAVSEELIRELLDIAVWAPSASNVQPWGFVVIQDKAYLKQLSERVKADVLERMETTPRLEQYRKSMENPKFDVFYDAPVLVLFYGKKEHPYTPHDCSMAALNFMLAARAKGLGTCWIGFATGVCDSPEFKAEHGVPEDYRLVAPIILGYPELFPAPIPRREYPIFSWRKG